jgi:hypothetical protein
MDLLKQQAIENERKSRSSTLTVAIIVGAFACYAACGVYVLYHNDCRETIHKIMQTSVMAKAIYFPIYDNWDTVDPKAKKELCDVLDRNQKMGDPFCAQSKSFCE